MVGGGEVCVCVDKADQLIQGDTEMLFARILTVSDRMEAKKVPSS